MKRLLICGSNGLVGQHLAILSAGNTEYETLNTSLNRTFVFDDRLYDYTQLDLTHKSDVKSLISSFHPDVVINAAGAADPDWCEQNREDAWKINFNAVESLVEVCRKINAKLLHISTDYVFDGKSQRPYVETDKPNPVNFYGRSKLAAENAIVTSGISYTIFRSSLIYGILRGTKKNYATKVIDALRHGRQFECAVDMFGSPVYVKDLANVILSCLDEKIGGLFHIGGGAVISRMEFALQVARVFDLNVSLLRSVKSDELPYIAQRPKITGFSIAKAQLELNFKPTETTQALLCMKQAMEIGKWN
jgi:dTDP-4-dehydrorhamnose reductase